MSERQSWAAPFHLTRSEFQVLAASTLLIVCARLPAFFYAHGPDDYVFNVLRRPAYFAATLGDGRFGATALLVFFHELGLRQSATPAVSALLGAIVAAFIGIPIC